MDVSGTLPRPEALLACERQKVSSLTSNLKATTYSTDFATLHSLYNLNYNNNHKLHQPAIATIFDSHKESRIIQQQPHSCELASPGEIQTYPLAKRQQRYLHETPKPNISRHATCSLRQEEG
jgi:hypothetical protein